MICTRFMLLGLQRSGTSILHELLANHPEITAIPQEVHVRPLFSLGPRAFTSGNGPYEERKRGHLAIFDGFASVYGNTTGVIGCKIALSSEVETIDLILTLNEFYPELKIIHVIRRDAVARFGSLLKARESGEWQASGKKTTGSVHTPVRSHSEITLVKNEFEAYVAECQRIECILNLLESSHDVLEVEYETEVLAGFKPRGMYRFLGVDPNFQGGSDLCKLAPPPEDYIRNYRCMQDLVTEIDDSDPKIVEERIRKAETIRTASEPTHYLLSRAEFLLGKRKPSQVHADLLMLLSDRKRFLDDGSRRHAFGLLERAWLDLQNSKLACDALEQLGTLFEHDADFVMLRAVVAHHMGQSESAQEFLDLTLKLNPHHARAHELRSAQTRRDRT